MGVHYCHAYGCTRAVDPKFLMCILHWRTVPERIKELVWATYRPGQEVDKKPSKAYLLVQRAAVWAVFVKEGGCKSEDVPHVDSDAFLLGPVVMKGKR
jgi:hypothetical protein